MQVNHLLDDVIFLVKGCNLPTKYEIDQMSFEEKSKLEIEQDQIIQIFRQQALLDIWQLKIKIAKLLKETSELRVQMMQNNELSENTILELKNAPEKLEERKPGNKKEKTLIKKTEKSTKSSNQKLKNEKIIVQNEKEETDFTPKNKLKIRINSRLPNTNKDIDDQKSENTVKYLEPNRKPKIRNLVKKNPRLDTFNLRIKNKEKNQTENNTPKYPFSIQQTNNESKKYSYLVSSLNPKNLILAESQSQKDSSPNSNKNVNSKKVNEKNLTNSKYQSRNKNKDTNPSTISNQSTITKVTEDTETNQPKKIKRKPTPRRQTKKKCT